MVVPLKFEVFGAKKRLCCKVRARIRQVTFGEDGVWKDKASALSGMTVQDGADAEILHQPKTASNEPLVDVEMRIQAAQIIRWSVMTLMDCSGMPGK